jgi:hypothetical protein
VEAIRALMADGPSAVGERTRTINQARALILTGSDDLRARFAKQAPAALVAGIASLRPRPGDAAGHATRVALRELGRRAVFLDGQPWRLDELIVPLVTARAPGGGESGAATEVPPAAAASDRAVSVGLRRQQVRAGR